MNKFKSKKIIVSTLNNSKIKDLLISILELQVLIFITKETYIAIINIYTYYIIYKLKSAQVFIIFIKNLE